MYLPARAPGAASGRDAAPGGCPGARVERTRAPGARRAPDAATSRAGAAARVARHRRLVAHDAALLVEKPQRPLHGDRLEAPDPAVVGIVEEADQQDRRDHDRDNGPDERRLDDHTLS